MSNPYILLVAFALAFVLTWCMRVLALRVKLIDVPNERSSHALPTPRGGGLAIVLAFAVGCLTLQVWTIPAHGFAAGLLSAGVLVAFVGAADDRWQLPAMPRLVCHLVAALWATWQLGTLPALPMLGWSIDLSWLAWPLSMLYIAWAINFFNFMDGIDGIASLEAITVAAGGALLNALVLGGDSWLLPALLGVTTFGFMVWNWPPARIFMGDAGSGFLGLAIGTMTLGYASQEPLLFWGWFILQGTFVVDATTTLLRRLSRGERPQEAHRTHAYQYAARLFRGHRPVTLAYGAVTLFWLLPLATLTVLKRLDGVVALVIAYAPLVGLAYRFHAGARERQHA